MHYHESDNHFALFSLTTIFWSRTLAQPPVMYKTLHRKSWIFVSLSLHVEFIPSLAPDLLFLLLFLIFFLLSHDLNCWFLMYASLIVRFIALHTVSDPRDITMEECDSGNTSKFTEMVKSIRLTKSCCVVRSVLGGGEQLVDCCVLTHSLISYSIPWHIIIRNSLLMILAMTVKLSSASVTMKIPVIFTTSLWIPTSQRLVLPHLDFLPCPQEATHQVWNWCEMTRLVTKSCSSTLTQENLDHTMKVSYLNLSIEILFTEPAGSLS